MLEVALAFFLNLLRFLALLPIVSWPPSYHLQELGVKWLLDLLYIHDRGAAIVNLFSARKLRSWLNEDQASNKKEAWRPCFSMHYLSFSSIHLSKRIWDNVLEKKLHLQPDKASYSKGEVGYRKDGEILGGTLRNKQPKSLHVLHNPSKSVT